MRLFLTGATGYIGLNIATTFRRAGYRVFGLTRRSDKASLLESREITPVIGRLSEPDSFTRVAAQCDVIIHAAADNQADTAALDRAAVNALLEATRDTSPLKTLIYTSGTWVLGECNGRPLTERSPYAPIQDIAWRPEVEQVVLNTSGVRGLVIRPGVVYGKSGGMTGMWFHGASNGGVVQVVGDGRNHWAMVHVDDLADGFLLAAQSVFAGEVFNLVDESRSTVMEMAGAAAKAAGNIRQIEFVPTAKAAQEMGTMAEALALNQVIDAGKAHRVLGWQPRYPSFVNDVETYYRAWRAGRAQRS
jgi:nucleoside-diphosphate-sugar epimerase